MSESIDVIIVDDEPVVCSVIAETIETFYTWGDVFSFTDVDAAIAHCRQKKAGVAIFILDVFLGQETAFSFLDAIADKFPMAYEDTIIITGNASSNIVDMCIASDISYLIEKPLRTFTLQLAVRAIVAKYIRFAKRLLEDPVLAQTVAGL
ncbi:Response regulator receiver domain-containing protein [Syntrophus gentianae]|uniref:Response regulator receiver domain-containing protein n=1 Tax=Syntrophus gentianae TaxID=43775 RepID=A0A1H7YIF0_9BACT|nr:response regulator [Syntrophus gentianae]SEM45644.1 Response regulator receiver domain-containing protein [Syntrophus gentianae]